MGMECFVRHGTQKEAGIHNNNNIQTLHTGDNHHRWLLTIGIDNHNLQYQKGHYVQSGVQYLRLHHQ